MRRVWVTTVGTSPYAVLNSLWAVIEETNWVPNRVYLVFTPDREEEEEDNLSGDGEESSPEEDADDVPDRVKQVEHAIKTLIRIYSGENADIVPREISQSDIRGTLKTYLDIVELEKVKEGNEVSIDITPGRKYMSAFALYAGLMPEYESGFVDHIWYLHLFDARYKDFPYPSIPANKNRLEDLITLAAEGDI